MVNQAKNRLPSDQAGSSSESGYANPVVRVGFIHTSSVLIPQFDQLSRELIPQAKVKHYVDPDLLTYTMELGANSSTVKNLLLEKMKEAEADGVDAVVITCSSLAPAIDFVRQKSSAPIVRIDQAMAEKAVALGNRIGIVATVSTTLVPTVELLEKLIAKNNSQGAVQVGLCDGALVRLLAGDVETHDNLVLEKLSLLMADVDVIVLAQASMSRVIEQLPESSYKVPILSSPRLAVESLASMLQCGELALDR